VAELGDLLRNAIFDHPEIVLRDVWDEVVAAIDHRDIDADRRGACPEGGDVPGGFGASLGLFELRGDRRFLRGWRCVGWLRRLFRLGDRIAILRLRAVLRRNGDNSESRSGEAQHPNQ
jgi:hypothetical protein